MSDYNPTYNADALFHWQRALGKERPNPLSMELRIVLVYFWKLYNEAEWKIAGFRAAGVAVRPDLKVERWDCLNTARNLCHDLFAVTSRYHPFHIHSEHGCNDKDCPAWKRGYGAAQGTVDDWCTHESRHGGLRSHVARR